MISHNGFIMDFKEDPFNSEFGLFFENSKPTFKTTFHIKHQENIDWYPEISFVIENDNINFFKMPEVYIFKDFSFKEYSYLFNSLKESLTENKKSYLFKINDYFTNKKYRELEGFFPISEDVFCVYFEKELLDFNVQLTFDKSQGILGPNKIISDSLFNLDVFGFQIPSSIAENSSNNSIKELFV